MGWSGFLSPNISHIFPRILHLSCITRKMETRELYRLSNVKLYFYLTSSKDIYKFKKYEYNSSMFMLFYFDPLQNHAIMMHAPYFLSRERGKTFRRKCLTCDKKKGKEKGKPFSSLKKSCFLKSALLVNF